MGEKSRMLVREQPHQEKAFTYYYSLGEKRNYVMVAKEFNVSAKHRKTLGKIVPVETTLERA